MINEKDNPVEWALMCYEFEEVAEHLQKLSDNIAPNKKISEEEFNVQMGHIYSHLNRIWNSRNHKGEISEKQFDEYSKLPKDIKLYG
jgi:hypothetical protein